MKKNENRNLVKTKFCSMRFSPLELEEIKKKAKAAGFDVSTYCRGMSLEGHVFQKANQYDLKQLMLLRKCLIEYKTNFSRISNLIEISSPLLNQEVKEVKVKIELLLKKFQLW